MEDSSNIFYILIAICLLAYFGLNWLLSIMDKSSIRKDIESRGGRSVSSKKGDRFQLERESLRSSFSLFSGRGSGGPRYYEVNFVDYDGKEHRAVCKVGLFERITWIEDTRMS